MTIQDLYNQAKSLNDNELQKLIDKLSTLQSKRLLKLTTDLQVEQERAERAKLAIEQIEQTVKASGFSLAQLGITSPLAKTNTSVSAAKRKSNQYSPENQNYAVIDDGLVEILFGRKAGIFKREGKAYTFDQLNSKQQQNAVSIVSRLNSR
jgi:DNA-binding protein H-NS